MRARLGALAVALCALLTACGGHSARDGATIPFLLPLPERTQEFANPPIVNDIIRREEQPLLDQVKDASRLPRTTAAGCVTAVSPTGATELGPSLPRFTARVLGHQVEVDFTFDRLPSSLACRPYGLTVTIYAGRPASSSYTNFSDRFGLTGSRGRVAVDLPWGARPPYHVLITTSTLLGVESGYGTRLLTCPSGGCLPGYRPPLHRWSLPQPVLPIRGLTLAQLVASFRYVTRNQTWPTVENVSCSSLRSCTVTDVTPGFPKQPYRVRYRVVGQQISGCWMAMLEGTIDPLPYRDPGTGPLELTGCASWLK